MWTKLFHDIFLKKIYDDNQLNFLSDEVLRIFKHFRMFYF